LIELTGWIILRPYSKPKAAAVGGLKEIEMGTGRKFSKKPVTRPRKGAGPRRRRDKVLKARLVEIGFDEAEAAKLSLTEVRELLKKHARKSTRKEVEARLKK